MCVCVCVCVCVCNKAGDASCSLKLFSSSSSIVCTAYVKDAPPQITETRVSRQVLILTCLTTDLHTDSRKSAGCVCRGRGGEGGGGDCLM